MSGVSQIKNIIFDMGGVLVELHPERCIAAFEALGATDVAHYVRDSRTEDLFLDFELGTITTDEFCAEVRRICRIDVDDEAVIAAWDALLEPTSDERRSALLRLKEQGYRLFILSNTCVVHWQSAAQRLIPALGHTIADYFEHCFLSYEMHCRKPSHEIFLTALAEAHLSADETIFIDDTKANIDAAAAVGLHTFHECEGHRWTDLLCQKLSSPAPPSPCSATIGFFDGVHKGHQHIIRQLIDDAHAHDLDAAIITFRQHPREVLQQDYIPKLLTPYAQREHLLRQTGIDRLISLDFTPALARLTAREFMTLLYDEYAVRRLIIGYDHRFGHDRKEGFSDYQRLGEEMGMAVVPAEALAMDGVNISSSVVRRLLAEGDISAATACLGRPYGFEGIVVRGRGEGRRIGFPTANLQLAPQQLIPRHGVYAVHVRVEDYKETFLGMMNIGCRPTYGGNDEAVEVNIFHFDEEIYDHTLSVEILFRLRDERKFDTVADLVRQLEQDKTTILTTQHP